MTMRAPEKSLSLFDTPADTDQQTQHSDLIAQSPAPVFCKEQLWLALRFYDLSLDVLCRDEAVTLPVAVICEAQGKAQVMACNQRANDAGVQAGLSLSAAYALAPDLVVLPRDERKEEHTLKRLAAWAKKYTPLVSLEAPQTLLLEIKGSLNLFGGIAGLVTQVQQDIQALGLQHYHAVAPTPTAAAWLCCEQHGDVAQDAQQLNTLLGALPVRCTGWPDTVLTRLQGMGIRRLRDCMRLPRDGFARRIGKQRLLELDHALGKAPDPRENFMPPDKFVAKREFLFALEKTDMIFYALEQLLNELSGFLRGRQSGIQTLTVKLYHQYAKASCIALGTAGLCREQARLAALLQQKLEQLQLPGPVVAVTMVSGALYPLAGSDAELFDEAAHHDVHWPELVEKLRARLGVRAVTGLCLVPEHRPEQAWQYSEPGTLSESWQHQRRPLWMLSDPCRMPLRQGKPHWQGVLTLVQGPERIETGWWDGQDVARDYFIATNPAGLCLWIYRERIPHKHHRVADAGASDLSVSLSKRAGGVQSDADQRWYLHGIFA